MFKILFLADVVGKIGRRALKEHLPAMKDEFAPDLCIVNGENSAGGLGIDPSCAGEIYAAGAEIITTGNHSWGKKTIIPYYEEHQDKILRPHNFAPGAAGTGCLIWTSPKGLKVAVINLIGRVFTGELVDCPFRMADDLLASEAADADLVFIDFHAEATSEKVAFGWHVDGRAHAVVGTHTHVQTADERVLPGGTAYITDVGMCGPYNSVIGVNTEAIVERFKTGRPTKFDVAKGDALINGVSIEFDEARGKASKIERIFRVYPVP